MIINSMTPLSVSHARKVEAGYFSEDRQGQVLVVKNTSVDLIYLDSSFNFNADYKVLFM